MSQDAPRYWVEAGPVATTNYLRVATDSSANATAGLPDEVLQEVTRTRVLY
jgi:hypothetical protein